MDDRKIVKSGSGPQHHCLNTWRLRLTSVVQIYIAEAKGTHAGLSCQPALTPQSKGCSNGQIFPGIMPNSVISHSPFLAYLL